MNCLSAFFLLVLIGYDASVQATEVGVVGLFPGKAILVVDGAPPKTYNVGSMISNDTKLLDVDHDSATIISNGKRSVLAMGQAVARAAPGRGNQVILQAGDHGHFIANASINGISVKMMVDTGASLVTLPASDAIRLGINYTNGIRGRVSTAGGVVNAYGIKIDSIKIGDIELYQVDAAVLDSGLTIPLLGMSFLNRMEMRREGDQMTLTKRF